MIKKQAVSTADVADHIRIRPNKAGMIKRALFISFVFSSRLNLPKFTDAAQKVKSLFDIDAYVNNLFYEIYTVTLNSATDTFDNTDFIQVPTVQRF